MRILVLGPIEVRSGDHEINLGGPKPKALLSALLLQPRQVVSTERLIDLIWNEAPPQSANALVHTYISALRRGFASAGHDRVLTTRAPGYLLDIDHLASDVEGFERHLDAARLAERRGDHDDAAHRYTDALGLWRGPAFGGVDADFARTRAAGLEEERLAAEEGLARCRLVRGHAHEVVGGLARLVESHPLREAARALLMRALFDCGRQADALGVYRDGRRQLRDELGIEPGDALRDLHNAILAGTLQPIAGAVPAQRMAAPALVSVGVTGDGVTRDGVAGHGVAVDGVAGDGADGWGGGSAGGWADGRIGGQARGRAGKRADGRVDGRADGYVAPRHLPPDIGDFTGRAEHLDTVLRLGSLDADSGRTVTPTVVVSGFGGAGKSALAIHAAHRLRDRYPDGQLFADLRGSDRDLGAQEVLGRFLGALGIGGQHLPDSLDDRVELFRRTVSGRRLVMVLDNARSEHQVRRLLPGDPNCLVIITSRSRLTGLEGAEPVELDFFPSEVAVEMLSKIVGAGRVAAEPEAAATIAALCGGIPLAIRAAAAKLLARPHWPLRALASRLSDERRRLDELAVGDLAIRSCLGLNYAELDDLHRTAFHLLTLLDLPDFGSWLAAPLLDVSLPDAEDVVEALVDLRLLDVAGIDAIGRVRYRFHDLVQLFGAEQAENNESPEVIVAGVTRTLATWLALVEAGAKRLPRVTLGLRPQLTTTIDLDPRLVEEAETNPTEWLKSETGAVVRAVERAHELGVDEVTTMLITSLLSSPFAARNEFDGWQRTHEAALAAARGSGDRQSEAIVLAGLGQLYYEKDDFAKALEHFEQANAHAVAIGDDATRAVALVGLGTVRRDLAVFTEAQRDLLAAAELAERAGDRSVVAAARYGLGAISRDHGDVDAAAEEFRRCVELYRELADRRGEALALRGLSLCRRAVGQWRTAADLSGQAEVILREAGDELGATYAAQSTAKALIRLGQVDGVDARLDACLEVCTRQGDRFGVALITRTSGELALALGDLDAAVELLTSALAQWTALGLPLWQARTLRDLAAAVSDQDIAARHWADAIALFAAAGGREAGELAAITPLTWAKQVRAADEAGRSIADL